MSSEKIRACRCGSTKFSGHQITRHDILVDSDGVFLEDKGVYDSETPYGPFFCARCGAEYGELSELELKTKEVITACVNGKLRAGDAVLSTQDDSYALLVGVVLEINLLGSPSHDTDNDTDDIHVDFMALDYSEKRMDEISEMFSKLYDEKKDFGECPIDDTIMRPDKLVRITGISDEIMGLLLECEDNARLFCQGVKTAASMFSDSGAGEESIVSEIQDIER